MPTPKKYSDPFVPKPPVDKDNPRHYVDNKRFYEEIKLYREQYLIAMEKGEERPQISNYLGECIWKIANGLAMNHNFRNYSYIDIMISTGVESCIKNMHMFDPEKTKNPFAYFTQCCYYDFLHVIKSEKKQSAIKKRLVLSSAIDTFDLQGHDEDGEFTIPLIEYLNGITSEDIPQPKKKVKQKEEPLGGLFDE
jgi:hypothetical protein